MTRHVDPMTADELARHANPLGEAGAGTLGTERGNLPLHEIDLRATITGLVSQTVLTQGFHNPYDEPLEATYIFPLPDRAAVTALRMETPDRVIDAVLRERGEARTAYDDAIAAGRRASIAEEERPGVFTMRVGNIMPAERVTIRLTLVGRLPFEDGAATFRFPLVVAPRYVPGEPLPGTPVGDGTAADTDAVPDASRITPPVLLPNFPNPVRLSATVDIDPVGLPLARITASMPVAAAEESDSGRFRVRLMPGARVDQDFVLRLALGADAAVGSLAVAPDRPAGTGTGTDGTFACTILPPATADPGRPRDIVLVVDRSGSMNGWKMVATRRAAARIVDTFTEADRFAVLAFDNHIETAPEAPAGLVPATDRNRFRAVEFLAGLTARGGTELLAPLTRAAHLFDDADRERVIVLVTDGQVGNEDQVLRALAPLTGGVRVHAIGVDTAVNAAFLRRLAGATGGRCELVESEDTLDAAMRHIHRRIGRPVVTNLRISPADLVVDQSTVAPAGPVDLYPGAPVVLTGRCTGDPAAAVTVTGELPDGSPWRATLPATPAEHGGLRAIWARAHVRDLEDWYVTTRSEGDDGLPDLERRIVAVSLKHGVLCRFTAFVAVDEKAANVGGQPHRVTQPVETPAAWSPAFAESPPPAPRQRRQPGSGRARARKTHVAKVIGPLAGGSVPAPMAPPGMPTTLNEFAWRALDRMWTTARSFPERIAVLAALATELTAWLDRFGAGEPTETVSRLREVATRLAQPPADPAALDELWQAAIDAFESFGRRAPRDRSFWKR